MKGLISEKLKDILLTFENKVEYKSERGHEIGRVNEALLELTPNCILPNLQTDYWDLVLINFYTSHKCRSMDFIVYTDQSDQFIEDLNSLQINPHLKKLDIRVKNEDINEHVILRLLPHFPNLKTLNYYTLKAKNKSDVNVKAIFNSCIHLEQMQLMTFRWSKFEIREESLCF